MGMLLTEFFLFPLLKAKKKLDFIRASPSWEKRFVMFYGPFFRRLACYWVVFQIAPWFLATLLSASLPCNRDGSVIRILRSYFLVIRQGRIGLIRPLKYMEVQPTVFPKKKELQAVPSCLMKKKLLTAITDISLNLD